MTIYFPDVSGWNAGISLAGALAVAVKVTEGTGYVSPAYRSQTDEAARNRAFLLAYHFLHEGWAAAQADFCHGYAGKVPLMLDMEPVTVGTALNVRSHASRQMAYETAGLSSAPTVADACTFIDRYRSKGGVIWWLYLPRWYWQQLGSPSLKPLADRGILLWSSDYGVSYTDDNGGRGWQPYGGMTPLVWQYTSSLTFGGKSNVDFSAFRGSQWAGKQDDASVSACLAEFVQLTTTGTVTHPDWVFGRVRYLTIPLRNGKPQAGPHSVRLIWYSPGTPEPLGVDRYEVCVRDRLTGLDVPGYPRYRDKGDNPEDWQFRGLPPGRKLIAMVRAQSAGGGHSSEWSVVEFDTPAA